MKDIHFFTEDKFDQYFIDAELFDFQGMQGTTYKKGNQVIKRIDSNCEVSEKALLQYRDTYIPDVYFIRAGIYVRKKIKACISEYASGLSLLETRVCCQEINTLLKAITRFEEAIKRLCQAGIRIVDINAGNILFSEDHFNIIDTVLYRDGGYLSSNDLTTMNYSDAFENLFFGIIPNNLYEYFESNGWFISDFLVRPGELIEKMLYKTTKIIGRPVDTIGEASRIIEEEKIKLL